MHLTNFYVSVSLVYNSNLGTVYICMQMKLYDGMFNVKKT